MLRHPLFGFACAVVAATVCFSASEPDPDFAAAKALLAAKQWPQARAALQQIVAVNPQHAAAQFELGLLLARGPGVAAVEESVTHLAAASQLAPDNERYLAQYGGMALQAAGIVRKTSFTRALGFANRGRAALEQAIVMNPDDLDAREWLYQFYANAPWPIGSGSKAAAQLQEIRQRDSGRAQMIDYSAAMEAKNYTSAFKALDAVLAAKPNHSAALFFYGRTAAIAGQNLDRGLQCLQSYLGTEPPITGWPNRVAAWVRIGNIQEKLKRLPEARLAYESALKLDANNKDARAGLLRVK